MFFGLTNLSVFTLMVVKFKQVIIFIAFKKKSNDRCGNIYVYLTYSKIIFFAYRLCRLNIGRLLRINQRTGARIYDVLYIASTYYYYCIWATVVAVSPQLTSFRDLVFCCY